MVFLQEWSWLSENSPGAVWWGSKPPWKLLYENSNIQIVYTPENERMTMEKQACENVSSIKNGDVPLPMWISGVYWLVLSFKNGRLQLVNTSTNSSSIILCDHQNANNDVVLQNKKSRVDEENKNILIHLI